MTVCLAVSVLKLLALFTCGRPVLLDYLVVQVVRVPEPIGDTFIISKYVGLCPASTLFPPPKKKEYQAYPENIFEI